jgi:hypothetical protein
MFLFWTYANTVKKLLAADGVFLLSLEYSTNEYNYHSHRAKRKHEYVATS